MCFLFVIVWLSVPVQSIAWKDSFSEMIYYVSNETLNPTGYSHPLTPSDHSLLKDGIPHIIVTSDISVSELIKVSVSISFLLDNFSFYFRFSF